MATPPVRARTDYDYLIKLLLIGDNGFIQMAKSKNFWCIRQSFLDYISSGRKLIHAWKPSLESMFITKVMHHYKRTKRDQNEFPEAG